MGMFHALHGIMSLVAFLGSGLGLVVLGALVSSLVTKSTTLGGMQFAESSTLTANQQLGIKLTTNAAWTSTLTTRTDNSNGTLTVQAGHNITTGAIVDMYWTNSDGSLGVRYGSTVGTVSGLSVPFTTGASGGQNLPASSTAINVCVVTNNVFAFTGNNVIQAVTSCNTGGPYVVNFLNSTTSEYAVYVNVNDVWQWYFAHDQTTNPFASQTITNVAVSSGQPGTQNQVQVGILSN